MIDKNTPSPGFGGMTFDEWMDSLSPEEKNYLYRHVMVGGITEDGEQVAIWVRPDRTIVTGGTALSAKPFQDAFTGLKDMLTAVLTDEEVEFLSEKTKKWRTIQSHKKAGRSKK